MKGEHTFERDLWEGAQVIAAIRSAMLKHPELAKDAHVQESISEMQNMLNEVSHD